MCSWKFLLVPLVFFRGVTSSKGHSLWKKGNKLILATGITHCYWCSVFDFKLLMQMMTHCENMHKALGKKCKVRDCQVRVDTQRALELHIHFLHPDGSPDCLDWDPLKGVVGAREDSLIHSFFFAWWQFIELEASVEEEVEVPHDNSRHDRQRQGDVLVMFYSDKLPPHHKRVIFTST